MKPPRTGPITGANNAGQVMRAVALSEFGLRRVAEHEHAADRGHQRAAEPLYRARGDELRQVVRQAAAERTQREYDNRDRENLAGAEAIGEPAGSGNKHRRRQEVDGYADAHADRRNAERGAHLRQRRRDDRAVQKLHEESDGDDQRHALG